MTQRTSSLLFVILFLVSSTADAGTAIFYFDQTELREVYDVYVRVVGSDTNGLYAYNIDVFDTDASTVSYSENVLWTVDTSFASHGFAPTTLLQGVIPTDPPLYNIGHAQGRKPIFGIGMVPIDNPGGFPPNSPHIQLDSIAYLGTITAPGTVFDAQAWLYDDSGSPNGFLPAEETETITRSGCLLSYPGDPQEYPQLPESPEPNADGSWDFFAVPCQGPSRGLWFGAPAASGYEYEITDGVSEFSSVGMPIDLGDANGSYMVTSSEGSVIVESGGFHAFATGQTSFTVTDIDPVVGEGDPLTFPTFISFNEAERHFGVNFRMTPIPEPSSLVLVCLGLIGMLSLRGRFACR